jgi:hypothetical protein
MCYNFTTSVVSFISVTISGIVAIYIKQPILGCLMLAYGLMQLSEIIIWKGIDTNNEKLNKIGTSIGKYTLPSHNIALGIGVLIAYWSSKNNPKYWVPLIVGIMFYLAIMITYSQIKDKNDGLTKRCVYPHDNDSCTKNSARLEWPYIVSWYNISFLISSIIFLVYIRPIFPNSILILLYFSIGFILTATISKLPVLGSYWCWASAAFAPVLVIVLYLIHFRKLSL